MSTTPMKDDCQITLRDPMYHTYMTAGSDMIHFTGHPQIALGNPLKASPKAEQNSF